MDITIRNAQYDDFLPSWTLMRYMIGGEDDITSKNERYLPMKTSIEAITNPDARHKAYERYKLRAEFLDLVALTVRGAVGTMLDKPAQIELPQALEPLRLRATRDGLDLAALHRRIATELMITGRYGILPGIGL